MATTEADPATTQNGKVEELDLLEEDDEFEEFVAETWATADEDHGDESLWEDNWDDDNINDDFIDQLREQLRRVDQMKA